MPRHKPEPELLLPETMQEKRREPQTHQDHDSLVRIRDTGSAEDATRAAHGCGSAAAPRAAPNNAAPTAQKMMPIWVLNEGPDRLMPAMNS